MRQSVHHSRVDARIRYYDFRFAVRGGVSVVHSLNICFQIFLDGGYSGDELARYAESRRVHLFLTAVFVLHIVSQRQSRLQREVVGHFLQHNA